MKKIKFLALIMSALLSANFVWGADSGLQPADGKFIIDFYDSEKLSSTSGTGLTNSNYSNFVKVATGLTKSNVVTSVSVTGTVQYGKNGGLTAGTGTAAGANSHYVTFNIGDDYAVNKVTVYATAYEGGKWQLNGTDASSGSLGAKGAAFSNVTSPLVWDDLDGVTTLTFKKMGTDGGNQKRLTIYTIVCEYTSSPSYTVTAQSNNTELGTVSGTTTITASPNECVGYDDPAYTVDPEGKATVNQSDNIFTVSNVTDNVTITINFAELAKDTYEDHLHGNTTIERCGSYPAPSLDDATKATTGDCDVDHYHFAGWVIGTIFTGTPGVPDGMVTAGTAMKSNGTPYIAVWAKEGN